MRVFVSERMWERACDGGLEKERACARVRERRLESGGLRVRDSVNLCVKKGRHRVGRGREGMFVRSCASESERHSVRDRG